MIFKPPHSDLLFGFVVMFAVLYLFQLWRTHQYREMNEELIAAVETANAAINRANNQLLASNDILRFARQALEKCQRNLDAGVEIPESATLVSPAVHQWFEQPREPTLKHCYPADGGTTCVLRESWMETWRRPQ